MLRIVKAYVKICKDIKYEAIRKEHQRTYAEMNGNEEFASSPSPSECFSPSASTSCEGAASMGE